LKKYLTLVLSVILIAALSFFFWIRQALYHPSSIPEKLPEIAKNLEFELDNVRYSHTRSGIKKWELSTRKAKRIKGNNEIIIEGVEAWIYASGKIKSDTHIKADHGSYLVKSGNISLSGNVTIDNEQFRISTQQLLYLETSDKILAPKQLKVLNDRLHIVAGSAEINLKARTLHFSGGVNSTLFLQGSNPTNNVSN
jgi:LPS export ABC transporter protein LptC